jgi:metal-responsive CopG/Arc/MetJ family transcriptional regulator
MARFEIELPDDLLEWVDDYAGRAGESRDEFLRRIIAEEIDRCHEKLREEIEGLLDSHPLDLGGKTAAELIRESRDSR